MSTLGNIIHFVFGGFILGTIYMLLGVFFCLTIVGIPIGKALFEYGKLMYFPFGKAIVRETFIKGKENVSVIRRVFGVIVNVIWFPIGFVMLIGNLGLIIICCITIIGIPAAIVIARASVFLLTPIGAKVITMEQKQAIMTANEIERRRL